MRATELLEQGRKAIADQAPFERGDVRARPFEIERCVPVRAQPGAARGSPDVETQHRLVQRAGRRNFTTPRTMVSRTRSSWSITTRSAHAPSAMRPRPRSPSTLAGTADARLIARAR